MVSLRGLSIHNVFRCWQTTSLGSHGSSLVQRGFDIYGKSVVIIILISRIQFCWGSKKLPHTIPKKKREGREEGSEGRKRLPYVTCSIKNRLAKQNYVQTEINKYKGDIKSTWVTLRHLLGMRNKSDIISSFNVNNECITDSQVISEQLCKYFTDIGPNLISHITTDTPNQDTHINKSGQHSLYLTPNDPVEIINVIRSKENKQEAQGLGALLDKMVDNDHINWITHRSRCIFHSKNCRFWDTSFLIIRNTPNFPWMTLTT